MALNIRNQDTEKLAEELALLTGETKTRAVTLALSERLVAVRQAAPRRSLADQLDEVALHCSRLPVRDPRSADEILGYDENGVPRSW